MRLSKLLPYIPPTFITIMLIISYVFQFHINFWKYITILGDELFYVTLLPVIYHGISRSVGIELIIAICTSIWLGNNLKNFLKMPRPPKELWLVDASGYGFPSGHALGSTVFWGYLSLYFKKIMPTSFMLIILISISRIILRVHYPFDVLGGLTIGVAVLAVTYIIRKRIRSLSLISKIFLTIIFSFTLLLISNFLSTITYIEHSVLGVLIGSYLGHVLYLKRVPKSVLTLPKRCIGALLALGVSFIGYKLGSYIPYDPLLLPHYVITSFTMIFIVGMIIKYLKL